MSRLQMNVVVDTVAFVAMVLLAATGAVMRYVLPPGSGHFSTLWGMDRHGWGDIHFWIAITLAAAVLLHIVLHWSWIVGVVKGRSSERSGLRSVLAIIGLVAIVGLAATPFLFATVEQAGETPHKQRSVETLHEERSGEEARSPAFKVDGTMTLREVEQQTGVPASVILKELGLPAGLPTDEQLGKLREKFNFQVHDIQPIVEKHHEQQSMKDRQ